MVMIKDDFDDIDDADCDDGEKGDGHDKAGKYMELPHATSILCC